MKSTDLNRQTRCEHGFLQLQASELSLALLLDHKRETTVSVVIPTLNEVSTIAHTVETLHESLRAPGLIDEIIVADMSTDATPAVARRAGARVLDVASIFPEQGPVLGKGDSLWRATSAIDSDVLVFLDADIRNFDIQFPLGVIAPLLMFDDIQLSKGGFERVNNPTWGGRVTTLTVRPALSIFYPQLCGFTQPCGGVWAIRRSTALQMPFQVAWGVDLGMLIDVYDRFGPSAIAQVELGEYEHKNRSYDALRPTALATLQVVLSRANCEFQRVSHYLDAGGGGQLTPVRAECAVRPPISSVFANDGSSLGRRGGVVEQRL